MLAWLFATSLAGWLVMLAQAGWLVRQRRLDASSLPVLVRGVLAALALAGGLWVLAGLEAIAGLGAIAGMLVLVLAGLLGWFVLARLAGIIPPELFSLLPRAWQTDHLKNLGLKNLRPKIWD